MKCDLESGVLPAVSSARRQDKVRQFVTIAITAFLTVVDLFAAQAILPSLTARYGVTPAEMAVAVNACTLGMAVSSLAVALFSARIDRRKGILMALILLAIPTALLAHAGDLVVFALLRIWQGLMMAAAFGLTLAYLGERLEAADAANAFAAYITGNVASNLVGRFIAAYLTDHAGLGATFYSLAALNLAGALLVYGTIERTPPMGRDAAYIPTSPIARVRQHLQVPELRTVFAIGFLILFAFIGTFSFVNFILMRPPLSISMMQIGLVYLVFLPSILTTSFAGAASARFGTRVALGGGLTVAAAGLPLLLMPSLSSVLAGMAFVAAGTFFAQAIATGYASRAAKADRGAASGLYLASYFLGGIAGSAVLGRIFDAAGWRACVLGIGTALLAAGLLSVRIRNVTPLSAILANAPTNTPTRS